jgi:type IV secretory pathway VirB4 component
MKDPTRDLRRPTLLQMDEFGYAAQVEAVLALGVEITKTARKYKVGLMVVDQNPVTFLGSVSGRQIFENAAAIIAFHLEDIAARQLGEALSALTPEHLQFLVDARKGAYVAVVNQDVYVGSNQLSPREQRYLLGS